MFQTLIIKLFNLLDIDTKKQVLKSLEKLIREEENKNHITPPDVFFDDYAWF